MENQQEKKLNPWPCIFALGALFAVLGNLHYNKNRTDKEGERIVAMARGEYESLREKYQKGDISQEEVEEMRRLFFLVHRGLAEEVAKKYKTNASVTLAQGALESDFGNSKICRETGNAFGIKCKEHNRAGNKGKEFLGCCKEYDDGFFKIHQDEKGESNSFVEYGRFLSSRGIYDECFNCGDDVECWARELKKAGYAEDPQYAEKLLDLIEKYGL